MRAGMAGMDKINFRVLWVTHLGHLAWALASAGKVEEAMDVLSKALLAVDQYGERAYEAELHRLRGDLLRAKRCESRKQRANFAERSKSRGRRRPGRGSSARPQALPSYTPTGDVELRHSKSSRRSIPGLPRDFDTADLRAARTLLQTLEIDAGVG